MSLLKCIVTRNAKNNLTWSVLPRFYATQTSDANQKNYQDEEFRVLNLKAVRNQRPERKIFKRPEQQPPRTLKMSTEQDWGSVWPGPKSFIPSSVPLPLRQGMQKHKTKAPPEKYANAELMKIPNFLHLTPPVIKKQCEALKRFCNPWPKGLENEEKMKRHFPIDYVSSDYCHALPTVRNKLSRIVTLQFKLSELNLDQHAKDKFLRLVGDRYNYETDILTIVTDRCPLRRQNYEYAMYLITACYHEAHIVEDWEAMKVEADMEFYHFNGNVSKIAAEGILNYGNESEDKQAVPESFGKSVEMIFNDGENEYNMLKYKEETIKLLGLEK